MEYLQTFTGDSVYFTPYCFFKIDENFGIGESFGHKLMLLRPGIWGALVQRLELHYVRLVRMPTTRGCELQRLRWSLLCITFEYGAQY